MTTELVYWVSIAALWIVTYFKWRDLRRIRRQLRREHVENGIELARYTGLTPLQIQVAMDAAQTTFHQRVDEMRRTTQ